MLTAPGAAYLVQPTIGTVQPLDPTTLEDVGPRVQLTPPLNPAGLDGRGTLWVPAPAKGQVVPVSQDRAGAPVAVGAGSHSLPLTIAGGTPVVTDPEGPP